MVTHEYGLINNYYLKALKKLNEFAGESHPCIKVNGNSFYRPFTFKENIEYKVCKYNSSQGKEFEAVQEEMSNMFLSSCTGIAINKEMSKAKINNLCEILVVPNPDLDQYSLKIDYSKFEGEEINLDNYNSEDIWSLLLEGNKSLFREYQKIIKKESNRNYVSEQREGFPKPNEKNVMNVLIKNNIPKLYNYKLDKKDYDQLMTLVEMPTQSYSNILVDSFNTSKVFLYKKD